MRWLDKMASWIRQEVRAVGRCVDHGAGRIAPRLCTTNADDEWHDNEQRQAGGSTELEGQRDVVLRYEPRESDDRVKDAHPPNR